MKFRGRPKNSPCSDLSGPSAAGTIARLFTAWHGEIQSDPRGWQNQPPEDKFNRTHFNAGAALMLQESLGEAVFNRSPSSGGAGGGGTQFPPPATR
jgi:hypothetical protein